MYHTPVLLEESVDGLNIRKNGIYVDATFGGGGHSKEILKRLSPGGRLIVFDQDEDAKKEAKKINDKRIVFVEANFRYIKNYLNYNNLEKVDGIIADFGVSSHQIDSKERGFSWMQSITLDMRMSNESSLTAEDILNTYSREKLVSIFRKYGELKNARVIAQTIFNYCQNAKLTTVDELKDLLKAFTPKLKSHKFFAQVFQALRIEVNDEINAIRDFLDSSTKVLNKKGRLVCIAYHSLEDRPIKNIIRTGNCDGIIEKDFYGKIDSPFAAITNKPIVPSKEELEKNSRSRSAKLRIAEKK